MNKTKLKVAVLCEYSGIVRDAFIRNGHDAISCDILPTESVGPHIKGDCRDYNWSGYDLIIAHPPCTYLSKVANRWLYPKGVLNKERHKKGLKARDFFMWIYKLKVDKLCIENPVPFKIYNLPEKSQIIQPYYFGDPFSKKTYLWLKGLPLLKKTNEVDYQTTKIPGNWYNKGGKDRQKNRSRTFPGIAQAMADQWG